MNRLFVYAIIINIVLLAVFILLDAVTWNDAALHLDSRIKSILATNDTVIGAYASYTIVQVGITARSRIEAYLKVYGYNDSYRTSINLPLIWFIVTIAVNLYLIWYLGIKRMSEPIKDSKTETVSARQEETN